MTPVEIGRGKSFKGLAAYLLHDPRLEGEQARTSTERIGWVQSSYNLDGAGGDSSWRLMAVTTLSVNALKQAAGIKIGPTPSSTAFHFSINFNPADRPSEEIERRAVEGALKAIGLDEYQALAVRLTDDERSHVHVMVNLTHPENGMPAASKQQGGAERDRGQYQGRGRGLEPS